MRKSKNPIECCEKCRFIDYAIGGGCVCSLDNLPTCFAALCVNFEFCETKKANETATNLESDNGTVRCD